MGRSDFLLTIKSYFAKAKIISQNEDDVRANLWFGGFRRIQAQDR